MSVQDFDVVRAVQSAHHQEIRHHAHQQHLARLAQDTPAPRRRPSVLANLRYLFELRPACAWNPATCA
jgi:hypothetical protein